MEKKAVGRPRAYTETTRLTVSIDAEAKRIIQELAMTKDRSVSYLVNKMLLDLGK